MNVLLVEPYFGGSHRAWAEGYRKCSSHAVEIVSLPARWWKWRMRGGAVTVAERCAALAATGYRPNVVLASSMTDVALLRSLLAPVWGRVPTALYLHESQFTYPDSPQMQPDQSYAFTNWTSALAADRIYFNSGYHLEVFFSELRPFLRGFPEHTHEHLIDSVRGRSSVLPVGVDLSWLRCPPPVDDGPPLVMWNHRWEHDKDPATFAEAVRALGDAGVEFRLALCGEMFRNDPSDFESLVSDLGDRVVHAGHAPVERYRSLLTSSSVVVSTARQEFFGTSVVEAVAAGARPVLPHRLSYPWLIPERFHGEVLYADGDLEAALGAALAAGRAPEELAAAMRSFGWDHLAPGYDDELASLSAR